MQSRPSFEQSLGAALGAEIEARPQAVGGGSINEAVRYRTSRGPVFVKRGPATGLAMFEAEAAGLAALADANAVRVPQVLAVGEADGAAFLALEWIEFGTATRESEAMLGKQLALQHRAIAAAFGWDRDNTIGSTPQRNAWCDDWIEFFRERRLGFQLDLASRGGASARIVDRGRLLCDSLGAFFSSYRPTPSLLHGDLWGGNWAVDTAGHPVIFDPAVYFGDREADIAMTTLFGGFGANFYGAYRAAWALDDGFETRSVLYNLYHVLNHYNLFGGGYLAQAQSMIDRLLAQAGR